MHSLQQGTVDALTGNGGVAQVLTALHGSVLTTQAIVQNTQASLAQLAQFLQLQHVLLEQLTAGRCAVSANQTQAITN